MNFLDIRTVLFSSIVTSALCAVVMNSLWRQNRRRSPELGFWLADFILQFAAILLIALRGILPDVVSVLLGVPGILLGALLMLLGLERYTGKTSPQRYNFILLAIFTLVHGYFSYAQPSLPARNINQSLGLLVFCGQCAWLLLRRVNTEMRPYTSMTGLIFTAYGLVSLARIFVDLAMPHTNDLFKSGLYDTLAILIYQVLFIGLTFALFLMVNRQLFMALENDIAERKMAEAALKLSQEKFSVAFQNTPDALVITSLPDGKIIEANESFFRISGYSKAESLGRTTIELNLWSNLGNRNQMVAALQQQKRVLNVDTDFRKQSGELFRGSISSELIQLQGQTCVLNVIHDITERQQAEETVRSLARFPAENPNPVLRITQAGKLLYANQAAFAQLKDWKLARGAPAPAALQASIRQVFETQATRTIEIPCGERTFSMSISPAFENEYVNLYGHDITDRKQAEDALFQANERLALAQHLAGAGIWDWDIVTGKLNWSPQFFELFGLDPARSTATFDTWRSVLHPEDLQSAEQHITAAVRDHVPLFNEYRLVTPAGETRWIGAWGDTTYNEHGEPQRMTGLCIDITARKRAEEGLQESEQRLQFVLQGSQLGYWDWNLETNEVQRNERWAEMLGYHLSDIEFSVKQWVDFIHPDDQAMAQQSIQDHLEGRTPLHWLEYRMRTKDGQYKWILDQAQVVKRDSNRRAMRMSGTHTDITTRKRMEEKLQHSEHNLAEAERIGQTGSWEYDVASDTANWSENMFRIFDVDPAMPKELVFKYFVENLVHPDDRTHILTVFQEALAGKRPYELEYRVVKRDGSVRDIHALAETIRDKDGKAMRMLGKVEDITERKQVEEALKQSTQRFEALLSQAPFTGVIYRLIRDEAGNITDWEISAINALGAASIGLSVESAIGKRALALFGEKVMAPYFEIARQVIASGQPQTFETYFAANDRFYLASVFMLDSDHYANMSVDITARKQAEEALHESEALLRAMAENYPNSYLSIVEKDLTIGYTAGQEFKKQNLDPHQFWGLELERVFGEHTPFVRENYLKTFDGIETQFELFINAQYQYYRTVPLMDQNGKITRILSVVENITARKRAEEILKSYAERLETEVEQRTNELREAQEKLVRQERLATLGQLAGSISHELRNPLGVISNAVYFLKMTQPEASAKVREYLDIIEKETRASDKIVTDLLDFTRIKSVNREPASVSELVNQTLQRYPPPPAVHVTLGLPADLPKIYADPQHILQVLGNLVINAYQAMLPPPSEGQAGATTQLDPARLQRQTASADGVLENMKLTIAAASQGDMIVTVVQDTGLGILPENMGKLFEPLFTTKTRGIGLGLAVSKKLIEANGGRIEARSKPGKGSAFTVFLPIYAIVPVPARDKEST